MQDKRVTAEQILAGIGTDVELMAQKNGRLEFYRSIFWNEQHGSVIPMDALLGMASSNHSLGVRRN